MKGFPSRLVETRLKRRISLERRLGLQRYSDATSDKWRCTEQGSWARCRDIPIYVGIFFDPDIFRDKETGSPMSPPPPPSENPVTSANSGLSNNTIKRNAEWGRGGGRLSPAQFPEGCEKGSQTRGTTAVAKSPPLSPPPLTVQRGRPIHGRCLVSRAAPQNAIFRVTD